MADTLGNNPYFLNYGLLFFYCIMYRYDIYKYRV